MVMGSARGVSGSGENLADLCGDAAGQAQMAGAVVGAVPLPLTSLSLLLAQSLGQSADQVCQSHLSDGDVPR